NEIIEFCGKNYLVSAIASDGSSITLRPTDLRIARVGETVPAFSLVLLNGKTFSSENLKGKNYILDFWATWCAPCIKNIPQINNLKAEFGKEITVLSVNVDKVSRRNLADKIIRKYQLFDFSVVRGLGNDDPLWKTFGSANQNNLLTIPLDVFVDKNGIVRYADSGGENLGELKSSIGKQLSSR
ncbi:MAG: TlpA family protein disulfide reductase, partial [Pyrinomonadaceae bacterium]